MAGDFGHFEPTGSVALSFCGSDTVAQTCNDDELSKCLLGAVDEFEEVAVESLVPGDTVWDTEVRGFGARRRRREITFVLKARVRGQQTFLTIGRFGAPWTVDLARKEAQRLLAEISSGRDPAQARRSAKNAPTLSDFAERYVTEHANPHKQPRTVEEDLRMLRLHILPALGGLRIAEISRADVLRFHTGRKAYPTNANRCLALLSHLFSIAEQWGERPQGSNPCNHVDRFPELKRELFLKPDELVRLGAALNAADGVIHPSVIAAARLLLLTGARLSEILELRWEWIDFERGIARLPKSKSGAKNLHLPGPALELLMTMPRLADNPFVLPGKKPGGRLVGIQKAWQRLIRMADVPGLRLHDLRHSFASVGAGAGLSLPVIGALLGHSQAATTQRYAHLASDPLKAASDLIAAQLAKALRGS
jgi:integrase